MHSILQISVVKVVRTRTSLRHRFTLNTIKFPQSNGRCSLHSEEVEREQIAFFWCDSCLQLPNREWFSVVCTLIDNDIRHHTDQNVVDPRGAATPNHCRHCFTRWREQRCLYSYWELWVKWISALSGRFKICGNECLYCIYISSYWNGLPSVIFWKLILLGICIELLRNFFWGGHIFDANNITY